MNAGKSNIHNMATLHHYLQYLNLHLILSALAIHTYDAARRQVTNGRQVGAFLTIARNSDDVHELSLVRIVV